MSRILVVDDEPADLNLVSSALEKLGHEVLTADTAAMAVPAVRKHRPEAAVLDVMLPDGDGLEVLERIHQIDEHMPVVFVTSSGESGTAIKAMKLGALDYLVKPIDINELRRVVTRALEIRQLTVKPVEMNADKASADSQAIIGRCHAMQEVYKAIGIVAGQDVTVLIRGESGTGKELVARALYQYSDRVKGPFLAVNCAAIPEALLESELFGHERGAFTGADRKRIGKFEQSGGGTLFLDEIGDMSPVLQSKLLRVLQEKQFERVGGNETISANVRVIAATNCNLEEMVADGQFRADLYYRLNGFSIHLPPLRERDGDLEALVEHFRRLACRDLNKSVQEVASESMEILRNYSWPGNVRELQNTITQGILKSNGPVLFPDFLPDFVSDESQEGRTQVPASGKHHNGTIRGLVTDLLNDKSPQLYDQVISNVEEQLVTTVLDRANGDRTEAARLLGINPATLRSKAALQLLQLDGIDSEQQTPWIRPAMTMEQIEREAIVRALDQTDGCRKTAAELLGISVRTMQRRVKDLDLD